MFRDFISLIFPQNCINCQQSLNSEEKFLCISCKIDLPFTNDFQNKENDLFKKFSFESKIKSAGAYMYFYHGGVAQKLLYHLKYHGKKEIGFILGKWLALRLSQNRYDLVIPVPLHKSKLRKRTFNQSAEIALGVAEHVNAEINTELIERIISTKSQTRKSKVERWANMQNVYSKIGVDLSGKSILVVDDVITTGATVGMLCERLVEANVESIHIAAVARGK
ncbi:ComF family protein [Ekhidna sp.]|uniref:ComF family protein n=1 Tax=Ekhidna sp. TaxID=2608089 RepID=UPI003BA8F9AD